MAEGLTFSCGSCGDAIEVAADAEAAEVVSCAGCGHRSRIDTIRFRAWLQRGNDILCSVRLWR